MAMATESFQPTRSWTAISTIRRATKIVTTTTIIVALVLVQWAKTTNYKLLNSTRNKTSNIRTIMVMLTLVDRLLSNTSSSCINGKCKWNFIRCRIRHATTRAWSRRVRTWRGQRLRSKSDSWTWDQAIPMEMLAIAIVVTAAAHLCRLLQFQHLHLHLHLLLQILWQFLWRKLHPTREETTKIGKRTVDWWASKRRSRKPIRSTCKSSANAKSI